MRNLSNPSQQCSKCQTRAEEIEKCLDDGLEPTNYFSIFRVSTYLKVEISSLIHAMKVIILGNFSSTTNKSAWEMFSEITYGLDELIEKITVITQNAKINLHLTENSKDVTIIEMNSRTFGRCYSIQLSIEIVNQGISELEFVSRKNIYIYFHHPGQFLQQSRSKIYTFEGK